MLPVDRTQVRLHDARGRPRRPRADKAGAGTDRPHHPAPAPKLQAAAPVRRRDAPYRMADGASDAQRARLEGPRVLERKNLSYLLVAEHRADRLQLEVVVRAVGEALVRICHSLEELGLLRVRHSCIFQHNIVELREARRGRVAL